MGVAGVNGIALAGAFHIGREEGRIDEGQKADATGVIDIDIEALADDTVAGEFGRGGVDLGDIHGSEAIGGGATGWTGIGRRDAFVDPAADFASKHSEQCSPGSSDRVRSDVAIPVSIAVRRGDPIGVATVCSELTIWCVRG